MTFVRLRSPLLSPLSPAYSTGSWLSGCPSHSTRIRGKRLSFVTLTDWARMCTFLNRPSRLARISACHRRSRSWMRRRLSTRYHIRLRYLRSSCAAPRGKFSDPIEVCRGVKQGDPLSPILFNCVVKYITDGMDAAYGIDLGGHKVNHLSFADDLVLLATSDEGLRCLVDAAVARMKTCGLNINIEYRYKC